MSRVFNGTTDRASVALDLSAYAQISLSFWMWWDTFANNDKLMGEFGGVSFANEGFLIDPNAAQGSFQIAIAHNPMPINWADRFPRPSAAVWHHYALTFNRATPVLTAYVNGVLQTLTTIAHQAGTYGNFSNSTFNVMCRNAASLFGAGRLAHLALYGGTILTARQALALSVGASPTGIGPMPTYYWPMFGDSPEPDLGGTQKSQTLTGTTIANHPRIALLGATP